MSARDAALEQARQKLPVFPLAVNKKIPTAQRWQDRATTQLEQVKEMFHEGDDDTLTAENNIGVRTGNGIVVVDLDPRNGSDASFAALVKQYGPLPITRTVKTAGGGRHFYLKVPADTRVPSGPNQLGPGIDIKGDGGYVVGPGSVINGKSYELEVDAPIAEAPPWLLEATTKPRSVKETPEQAPKTLTSISHADLITLRSALYHDKFREQCADNGWWSDAGYSLLSLGSIGRELFCEWSRETPGYEVGAPEQWWASHADQTPRADWRHILTKSLACGWKPPGAIAPTDAFGTVDADPGTPPPPLPSKGALDAPGLPKVVIRELGEDWDTRPIPKQSFVVEVLLPRGKVTLLISAGGMGKTYIVLYLAICIALGLDFFGYRCEPGRVVILSGEDSFDTLHYRLRELCRQIPQLDFNPSAKETIRQKIHFVDVEAMRRESPGSLSLTKSDRGGSASVAPFATHLAEAIGPADLVIVDTASRFNGGEENSNGDAARLIEALEIIAAKTSAAVFMLAHTGKVQIEGQYAARGASAFSDNARSVLVLAPLDPKKIEQLVNPGQVERAARNDILRLCHTKSNYAVRAEEMHFERHDSGALLPTTLTYAIPTDVDLVSIMLEKIGSAEVTKQTVRDGHKQYFPAHVCRKMALEVFDDAVRVGRLEESGRSANNKSIRYRVKQPAAVVGSEGLV